MLGDQIIIIGSGIAGYSFAKEFRRLDKDTPVIMITADDGNNYYKPNLSTAMASGINAQGLVIADIDRMSRQLDIHIRTFTRVTNIDKERQQIMIGEEMLGYSKLVLAVGAENFRLEIENMEPDGLHTINDLTQYSNFRSCLDGPKRIVVLGAGLIGCEYATDFCKAGHSVDVIAPSKRVLESVLPVQSSNAIEQSMTEIGINFHFSTYVESATLTEHGRLMKLSNGDSVICDTVVSAAGLLPRLSLAKMAGVKTNKGIVVNRSLQTSDQNIYALGDCAEINGEVMMYILPLLASAKVLARVILGSDVLLDCNVAPVVVKTSTCPTVFQAPPKGAKGNWQVRQSSNYNVEAAFHCENGNLLGFALSGEFVKQKMAMSAEIRANTFIEQ